jgi:hypothetical protein
MNEELSALDALDRLLAEKRMAEAAALAVACCDRFPDSAEIHYKSATAMAQVGEIDSALNLLERAAILGKDARFILLQRGQFEALRGNFGSSIRDIINANLGQARDLLVSIVIPSLPPQVKLAGISGRFVSLRYSLPRWNAVPETVETGIEHTLAADHDILVKLLDPESCPDRTTIVDAVTAAKFGQKFERGPLTTNSLYLACINNARILNCYIFNEEGDLTLESVPVYEIEDSNDIEQRLRQQYIVYNTARMECLQKLIVSPKKVVVINETCISLGDTANYFHYHLQNLGSLSLMREYIDRKELKILVTERSSYQRESLELAGVPPENIIFMQPDTVYRVARLLFPSLGWSKHTGYLYAPPRAALDVFERIKQAVVPHSPTPAGSANRIYIARFDAGARAMENERAFAERLSGIGFQIVISEKLSFREQVRLFSQADVIVGPHGAGLTNCVYCRPGTTIIELAHCDYFVRGNIINLGYAPLFASANLRSGLYLEHDESKINITGFHTFTTPIFTWNIDIDNALSFISMLADWGGGPARQGETTSKASLCAPEAGRMHHCAPQFQHLISSQLYGTNACRYGIPILKGCLVTNPDGTGFGGGQVEVEIIDPFDGDRLRLIEDCDISIHGGEVYFRGDRAADCENQRQLIGLRLAAGVFFEPVAAILASVRFQNPRAVPGKRRIRVVVTDADGDAASALIRVDVSSA